MIRKFIIIITILFVTAYNSISQPSDTTTFSINTRLSFYSYEKSGDIILHSPRNILNNSISIKIFVDNILKGSWEDRPLKQITDIPFALDLLPGKYRITSEITSHQGRRKYKATTNLIILRYKANEVKTDRYTGGLIVGKRLFFPFGFYCYSPVYPTLPEEEAAKGFNMISPYQKITPSLLPERKSYMDRCAQLGMKVLYNLISITGGGGVGSTIDTISGSQKMERLKKEVNTFMNHPALLGWYIADEPNGNKIPTDSLVKIYNMIKAIDPWHPVSVVFTAPYSPAEKYSKGLDIVMADPYPVPDLPASYVGTIAASLSSAFEGKYPVWIVPQAFGGGELWAREPTLQEIRAMTYLAIINGARGIQYFVRQGLNLFPKSTATWAECGRMAVEIAELTPWLLSDEETITVRSVTSGISVMSRIHDEQLMIMTANKFNRPQKVEFQITRHLSGKMKVLFENRTVRISNGYFTDELTALGTQVYLIDLQARTDSIKPWKENMIMDPGFEDNSSPGVPASCYARGNQERGATFFLDTREHVQGNHSLRLITPTENGSIHLRFFPVTVKTGATYLISVYAKADPAQKAGTENLSIGSQYFELSLGDFKTMKFILKDTWHKYLAPIKVPLSEDPAVKANVILDMPSPGVAWFDMLQLAESPDIYESINPALNPPWITPW